MAEKMIIQSFDQKDDDEIARAGSYAIFPELEQQDKILHMLLQHRAGIQFRLGALIQHNFPSPKDNKQKYLNVDPVYKLEIKVIGKNSVDLSYTAKIIEKNPWDSEDSSEAFNVTVNINITPDKVLIKDFNLTKVIDNENTNTAFELIQSQQQNILMQLLTYIKHALGFDSELRIDTQEEEQTPTTEPKF
ncbi:MAG: hypothetical protein HYX60_02200 [Legionella longbeachae]|nr:hypothetical protein [Legionella longbeachae]